MTGKISSCGHIVTVALSALWAVLLIVTPSSALLFDQDLPKETKARNLNLLAAGATVAWGVVNWDYFQVSPRAESEGWFERDTDEGGADKLGHFQTTYALSHFYASIFDSWGYEEEPAQRLGALSSLGTMTIMEVGDSFSSYGFSHEDMIMNCLGAVAGYWLGTHPGWQKRVDLRVEYVPDVSELELDVVTDYEHMKFLVAFKAEGFESLENNLLSYLELHAGYYTRGYDYRPHQLNDDRERIAYIGLGLNVGKLIEDYWDTDVFDYLQVPYTYFPLEHDLN